MDAYREATAAHEASRQGVLQAIKNKSKKNECTKEEQNKLFELNTSKPVKPKIPDLLLGEATSEALVQQLANYPSGGILSDEGGIIIGSHAMSADKRLKFMAILNAAWSGKPLKNSRVSTESFEISNFAFTFLLMIQPKVLENFMNEADVFLESGLAARCLFTFPESLVGKRLRMGKLPTPNINLFNN